MRNGCLLIEIDGTRWGRNRRESSPRNAELLPTRGRFWAGRKAQRTDRVRLPFVNPFLYLLYLDRGGKILEP